MIRFVFVSAAALAVSGCASSWIPSSLDFMVPSSTQTAELRIESEPPGADAKTSTGANCRTPCMLNVAVNQEFSVTISANGYQPQMVAVTTMPPGDPREAASGPRFDPNPVIVQLEPVPPPAKKTPAKKQKRRTAASSGQPS